MGVSYLNPTEYETPAYSFQQVVANQKDMVRLGAVSRDIFCGRMRGNGAIIFPSAATSTTGRSSVGYAAHREFACGGYVHVSGQREWNVEHRGDLVRKWDEWWIEYGRND